MPGVTFMRTFNVLLPWTLSLSEGAVFALSVAPVPCVVTTDQVGDAALPLPGYWGHPSAAIK